MKKLVIAAFLAASLSLSAQTEKKEVTLSLAHFELYSIMRDGNSFKHFPKIPEKVNEVYEGGKLQYTEEVTDYYILRNISDNEIVFFMNKLYT